MICVGLNSLRPGARKRRYVVRSGWAASQREIVAGLTVWPWREGAQILIPLEQQSRGSQAIPVEVFFSSQIGAAGTRDRVTLDGALADPRVSARVSTFLDRVRARAGIGSALMRPALRAALPAIAGEAKQTAAAVFDTCRWVGITVGPLFAAGLFYISGVTLPLALNAGSCVIAAAILATVPTGSSIATAVESGRSTLREGLAVGLKAPGVGAVIACSSGVVIAGGLLYVCEPLFATQVLHGSGSDYALLVTAYGVGMVDASALVARRGDAPANVLATRYVGALLLSAVGMGGSAAVGSVALAALSFAATGYANALLVVSETQLIQIRVPNSVQGRLFGAKDTVEGVFLLTGLVGASALVAAGGVRFAIAVGASLCAGCTVVAAGLLWASENDAVAVGAEPFLADQPPLIRRFDPRVVAEPAIIASEAAVHAAPPAS